MPTLAVVLPSYTLSTPLQVTVKVRGVMAAVVLPLLLASA